MRWRWRIILAAVLSAAVTFILMNLTTISTPQVDNSYRGIFCNIVGTSAMPMAGRGYPLTTIRYVNGACGYDQEILWLNVAVNFLACFVIGSLALELLAVVSRKSIYSSKRLYLRPIFTTALAIALIATAVNGLMKIL